MKTALVLFLSFLPPAVPTDTVELYVGPALFEQAEPGAVSPPDTLPVPAAPITFSGRQTEHVRLAGYDPFGAAGELAVDLDALAGAFCYPCPGDRISNYGLRGRSMHTGIDIKAAAGDTIRAALGGVVRMSRPYAGYGNTVVIRHPNGLETVYAHHSANLVVPNDVVRAGDPIALAGRTGRATTEHLHFEVRVAGRHFDPNRLLDTENRTLRSGTLTLRWRDGRLSASNAAAGDPPASDLLPGMSDDVAPAADVHVVRRGDTLYALSRRYGVAVDRLCALNGITAQSILSVGQRLVLK